VTNVTASKTRWSVDKIAVIILLISMAVRIGYLLMVLNQTSIQFLAENPFDTKRYMAIADAICNLSISGNFDVYWLGLGYGLFLAVLFSVSGKSLIFVLLFQILLSSISSVLIYKIGYLITRLRTLAVLAALVHIFSLTSVALSTSILSETVFFLCLLLLIYLFIRMNENPTPGKYIALALLVTYATFVRSVGQFIPFLVVAAVTLTPRSCFTITKRKLVRYTVISMAGALCLLTAWSFRNYVENKTFVVAGNGIGTAGWYLGTRVASDRSGSQTIVDFRNIFHREMEVIKNRPPTPRERNDWYTQKLWSQFTEDPVSFAQTYFSVVWENMTAADLTTRNQFPKYDEELKVYRGVIERYKISTVIICLSVLGFFFLLANGSRAPSILLGLLYIYFAFVSGFTYWQGSRIFFPAQASYAIFLASVVFFPMKYACHTMTKVNWAELASGIRKIGRRIAVSHIGYGRRYLDIPPARHHSCRPALHSHL